MRKSNKLPYIRTTSIYLHAEEDARHASTIKTRADASVPNGGMP
jgi:integrase/recombinase XerC